MYGFAAEFQRGQDDSATTLESGTVCANTDRTPQTER